MSLPRNGSVGSAQCICEPCSCSESLWKVSRLLVRRRAFTQFMLCVPCKVSRLLLRRRAFTQFQLRNLNIVFLIRLLVILSS